MRIEQEENVLELLELLGPCLAGTHDLAEILEVNAGFDSSHVARWCRRCGSAVVDLDYDNRTQPGRVMRMRSSEFLKQASARIHAYLLRELLVTLRADRAHRLFGKGYSEAALMQKAAGKAPISEELALKVRFLAAVVRHLEGAYSNDGVCAWFERERTQLGGKSPAEILTGSWEPASKDAQNVLELARSLSSSPAT